MPNIEAQSKDALVEAKVRLNHLFSWLPTQNRLWVSSSQPGHRISDPHTCFLPAWTTRPQWLVSSHGQALSSFPLSDCPSVQRLRLQTSRSPAHGSLWSVHTRPATPQLCWQERLRKPVTQGALSPFVYTSPLSCFKTVFFFYSTCGAWIKTHVLNMPRCILHLH